jgi:DNA-binding SARP family transcriptional activator
MVARARLVEQLRGRFTWPVTAVTAPAGFGKSTLLTQAIAENRLVPAGTDCFVAVRAEHGAASALADALLRAAGVEPAGRWRGGGDLVGGVVDAVGQRSPEPMALVLDDAHEIPADSSGADLLRELVTRLPGNGHVVVAGREPLCLSLARLDVAGRLLHLDERDLAFTADELARFAAARGVPAAALAATGGWPALAEMTAAARPGVEAEYLWDEVLAGIDAARRRDLAVLAMVGPLDDDLASATLGRPVDLDALIRGLPLVDRGSAGTVTIHALWRPHLADRLDLDDGAVLAACRRAAAHLSARGDVFAAIDLIAGGGAGAPVDAEVGRQLAAVLIGALGEASLPIPPDVARVWHDRLPEATRRGPVGGLLRAMADVVSDPAGAARHLEDATASFRRDGDVRGELVCLSQQAQLAWWRADRAAMTRIGARVLEMEAAGHGPAAPLASVARALVADMTNQSVTALAELDGIPAGALNRPLTRLVDQMRAGLLLYLGRPDEALVAARRACDGAGVEHAAVLESTLLQMRWHAGDVDEVAGLLPAVVDRVEAAGRGDWSSLVASGCAAYRAWIGHPADGARHLERARRAAASPDAPLIAVNLATAAAAVAVAAGDEEEAAAVLVGHLDRFGFLAVKTAATQRRTLALWYVLVASTRAGWEAEPLGPCWEGARALARALVAVRHDGRPPPDFTVPSPVAVRVHLPSVWATELGLAALAADRPGAWPLLESLWPAAHGFVRARRDEHGPLGRAAKRVLARLAVPPPARYTLRLLGPVQLLADGVPVDAPDWRRERVRSLLAHLALCGPVPRDRLADDLWPALDADAQSRNLRVNLSHLLRVLEPDRVERDASYLVAAHGAGLCLHRGEWFDCDIWQFDERRRRAAEADRSGLPSVALGLMEDAVRLWRGEPTELAEDWARAEVDRCRHDVVAVARRAAELSSARGDHEGARRMGEALLRADPWSDAGYGLVITALEAGGDRAGAARSRARYGEVLDELGVDGPTRARLLAEVGRGSPRAAAG